MTARTVAVLDIGKTNAKLVVHDLVAGRDLFQRTTPNTVLQGPPYRHFDVAALERFALQALAAAALEHRIDAVSVTTHGASAVLLAGGDLAFPVLDYEDPGPDDVAAAYDAVRPDFAETASPRLDRGLNVGAQLFWLQTAFPEAFARVDAILTYPQYWAFRLSGVPATEITSLGAHTDLWNPAERRFSSLVTARGWDRLMAPRRSAFETLGPIRPEVAEATGLPADTPVLCGIHDSNASLLPHLLTRTAPFTVVSTGTWVIAFAVGADLAGLDPARDTLANVNAFGEAVPGARFMGGREFDSLVDHAPVEPSAEEIAAAIDGGVMALPSFVAHSGPFPGRAGSWTVPPDTLAPGLRTAVASLYAALMTATALEVCGARGPTIVEGPFARNRLFADALARLTGRSVLCAESASGTAAGAALLALGPTGDTCRPPEVAADGKALPPGLETYAARWLQAAQERSSS